MVANSTRYRDGQKVVVLDDTACTGVVMRRNLVSQDQLIGKESTVTLIEEITQRHPLAVINVDCPFFKGQTEALCIDDTLSDLVIGNIEGYVPFFSGCSYKGPS